MESRLDILNSHRKPHVLSYILSKKSSRETVNNLPGVPAGIVRASSVFPILSTVLLMLGGLCVGAGRVYNKINNVLLGAGILFVAAGELEDYTVSHTSASSGHVRNGALKRECS